MWTGTLDGLGLSEQRRMDRSRRTPASPTPASGGCSAWCTAAAAAGEDDALLAQPLRDRLLEDGRRARRRSKRTRLMAAKASRIRQRSRVRSRCCATTRSAISVTSCSRSRRIRRCSCGSTAGTTRRRSRRRTSAREVMELFTMGVGNYTETDVYAAARVFTGWNLAIVRRRRMARSTQAFVYNAKQHETSAKTFSFPIYADGGQTIPARPRGAGMQDGVDLITALAAQSRRRRAGWRRSCIGSSSARSGAVDPRLRRAGSRASISRTDIDMRAVMREVLLVAGVLDPSDVLRPLLVAGRIRRARAEGRRLDRLLARTTRCAARRTWGRSCSTRPTSRGWELGPGMVLDRRDAGAHELRRDARGQSEIQPRRGCPVARASTPESLLAYYRRTLATAAVDGAVDVGAARIISGPAAHGPAATRNCRPRRRAWSI